MYSVDGNIGWELNTGHTLEEIWQNKETQEVGDFCGSECARACSVLRVGLSMCNTVWADCLKVSVPLEARSHCATIVWFPGYVGTIIEPNLLSRMGPAYFLFSLSMNQPHEGASFWGNVHGTGGQTLPIALNSALYSPSLTIHLVRPSWQCNCYTTELV